MHHADHTHHHHHATREQRSLSRTAWSATLNCLTAHTVAAPQGDRFPHGAWGSLAFSLAVAAVAAFPVNRWLIARGKGHAVVHAYHH